MLVGDQKSIKRGKEVINELLNLQSPAQTDTAAAAQPKNAPTKTKTPTPTPKTKKLPPLPSEPKPVGQVSRFSLLGQGFAIKFYPQFFFLPGTVLCCNLLTILIVICYLIANPLISLE